MLRFSAIFCRNVPEKTTRSNNATASFGIQPALQPGGSECGDDLAVAKYASQPLMGKSQPGSLDGDCHHKPLRWREQSPTPYCQQAAAAAAAKARL